MGKIKDINCPAVANRLQMRGFSEGKLQGNDSDFPLRKTTTRFFGNFTENYCTSVCVIWSVTVRNAKI